MLAAGRRKNIIHGLIEIDATEPRRVLRRRAATGEDLSFTAFLMHAVARTVDEDRILHAYRRGHRLILFDDDVDINVQVEVEAAGQKIVKPMLVRAANHKSVQQLSAEIHAGMTPDPGSDRRSRGTLALLRVPRPERSLAWRAVMRQPQWVKPFGGTVGISSVGMFGPRGAGASRSRRRR